MTEKKILAERERNAKLLTQEELLDRLFKVEDANKNLKEQVDNKRNDITALLDEKNTMKRELREKSQLLEREEKINKGLIRDLKCTESRLEGREALIKELYQVIGEDRVQERYLKKQICDLETPSMRDLF